MGWGHFAIISGIKLQTKGMGIILNIYTKTKYMPGFCPLLPILAGQQSTAWRIYLQATAKLTHSWAEAAKAGRNDGIKMTSTRSFAAQIALAPQKEHMSISIHGI